MAAADRVIAQTGTGPTVSGSIQDELTGLWNQSDIHLTAIAGTGDAITATLAPALTAGITAGMKFSFVAAATNTGAATIAINGGAAIALTDEDGDALAAGLLVSGRLYKLVSDGTSLRVMGSVDIQKVNNFQTFTASGTWTKPAGTPDDALVLVYAIGGGGGGGASTSEGGGGGGFGSGWVAFRAGNLTSTVAVTIGSGGAIETAGGNTTFGAYLTAYGGGRSNARGGGGGGSAFAVGGNNSGDTGGTSTGDTGTGGLGSSTTTNGGDGGSSIFGGGGGGGGNSSGTGVPTAGNGGYSIYGGGGGGGNSLQGTDGTGGQSKNAGAGGSDGIAGSIPGGGGGRNAAGARGQITVHVIG